MTPDTRCCEGEGPYTCRLHGGRWQHCSNPKCRCHVPPPEKNRELIEKEWNRPGIKEDWEEAARLTGEDMKRFDPPASWREEFMRRFKIIDDDFHDTSWSTENIKSFIAKVAEEAEEKGRNDEREEIIKLARGEYRLTDNCLCEDDGMHYFCDRSFNQGLSDIITAISARSRKDGEDSSRG